MLRATIVLLLFFCAAVGNAYAERATTPSLDAQVEVAMALPHGLLETLGQLRLDREVSELGRVQRLFDFMVADDGLALRYQEHPTYGIAESYAQRKVNCLSFTLMFIAMARASGMRAYAQTSDDALAMHVLNDTLYRAKHMKAGIDIDGLQYTVDVGWRSVVAERTLRLISDGQAIALLHNNNAVERLLQGDKEGATTEVMAALTLDAESATIWNNAGVVHWRAGRRDAAEHAYMQALELQRNHIGALNNLVSLHRATGAARQAESYGKRLQRAQATDPFSQFMIAQELANSGAYEDAIAHYRRAIRLLPGEQQFYRSLADAYLRQGDAAAAQRARNRATMLEARKFAQRGIRDAVASDPG